MSVDAIRGIILAVTHSIHLQPPARAAKSRHQFLAGRRIGVEWWTTWKTVLAGEKLARVAKAENASLASADESRLAELFIELLKESVVHGSLFDTWAIFCRSVPTLYEAIVPHDKTAFAETLYRLWLDRASAEIFNWLVLIPLESVDTISAAITDSLTLLPASEREEWNKLRRRFPGLVDFNVVSGSLEQRLSCFSKALPQKQFCWAVFKTCTSADAARTFLSIAFSTAASSNPGLLLKTGWQPTNRAVQFAETPDGRWLHAGSGSLMPPISSVLALSEPLIEEIRRWYAAIEHATSQRKRKLVTASHFLHQALLTSDTQQFIWYFVVLDALFGERHRVERMILSGIEQLTAPDKSWVERCRFLFDLRSARVHGEVTSIHTWRDLSTYRRLFHSQPLVDVQEIALRALRQFPFLFA